MTDSIWQNLRGDMAEAPVAAVCVLEDRAQVTRRAILTLKEGSQAIAVAGVTPLIADRTVRCRLHPVQAADVDATAAHETRVLSLQVERRYVVRGARPERESDLRAAIETLVDEYLEVYDTAQALAHERKLLANGGAQLTKHMRNRLGLGQFDEGWGAEIRQLMERRADLETQLMSQQWQQEDRQTKLQRLYDELRMALQPVSEYQAALVTDVSVATAGSYRVEWEYLVPCALWRPAYVAELDQSDSPAQVDWTSSGTVWQATGEDWQNIELSLSTARPTLGAELPLLEDDLLRSREKTEEEKDTIQVTSRDEVIASTETAAADASDTPPGLDDGGEARTFVVPEKANVPSDGRPHRLTFESWSVVSETELLCLPERAEFVFLRSLQDNPSRQPLLAGPVALVKNRGFVGHSSIRYVAPGERFALSWGSEDDLVVLRQVMRQHEEKGLRKHHQHRFRIEVYIANHSANAQTLRIVERLPVSELAQVKVDVQKEKTTPAFDKDNQGLVSWKRSLPAGGEERIRLAFDVLMPANVHWQG